MLSIANINEIQYPKQALVVEDDLCLMPAMIRILREISPTGSNLSAKLAFKCKVTEINEKGLIFKSKNFIPKGRVLALNGNWLCSIDNYLNQCLVSVKDCQWVEANGVGHYETYALFDFDNNLYSSALKRWLVTQLEHSKLTVSTK